jgi:hypothetical protein
MCRHRVTGRPVAAMLALLGACGVSVALADPPTAPHATPAAAPAASATSATAANAPPGVGDECVGRQPCRGDGRGCAR